MIWLTLQIWLTLSDLADTSDLIILRVWTPIPFDLELQGPENQAEVPGLARGAAPDTQSLQRRKSSQPIQDVQRELQGLTAPKLQSAQPRQAGELDRELRQC